jgi:hypothetical protein
VASLAELPFRRRSLLVAESYPIIKKRRRQCGQRYRPRPAPAELFPLQPKRSDLRNPTSAEVVEVEPVPAGRVQVDCRRQAFTSPDAAGLGGRGNNFPHAHARETRTVRFLHKVDAPDAPPYVSAPGRQLRGRTVGVNREIYVDGYSPPNATPYCQECARWNTTGTGLSGPSIPLYASAVDGVGPFRDVKLSSFEYSSAQVPRYP